MYIYNIQTRGFGEYINTGTGERMNTNNVSIVT